MILPKGLETVSQLFSNVKLGILVMVQEQGYQTCQHNYV